MLSKIKSLSVRLAVYYIISVLVILVVVIAYIDYQDYKHATYMALWNSEIGLGYLNGATPEQIDAEMKQKGDTFNDIFMPLNYEAIRNNFIPFIDPYIEGGVGYSQHITKSDLGDKYYELTFDATNIKSGFEYTVGPIVISNDLFPDTVFEYTTPGQSRLRIFLYLPVDGYDNLVLVASMDRYTYPVRAWWLNLRADLLKGIPLILIFTLILGGWIIWKTTAPLRRITRTAEVISQSDFGKRVNINSDDEIGSLAKSFNRMADSVQNTIESQKRFISDAAHELKTPLASMKTTVTGAMDSEKSPQECQELLTFLSGRINTQEELIGSLLFLARADEGRLPLDMKVINLPDVIHEAEDAFRYLYEDKGVELQTDMEAEITLMADSKMLFQLFSNLLDNALKHTSSGGSVYIKAANKKDSVSIEIKDTGEGIPEEHLPHIFERFYRIEENNDNGFGLGMAICKSIVEAHEGDINVESELGKGTVFKTRLPLILR